MKEKSEKRNFLGSKDDSAIIVEHLFPGSDIVVSAPFWFGGKGSKVRIEGFQEHLEALFPFLGQLINGGEENYAGKWVGIEPPYESQRITLHYEVARKLDKIQLLNFLLRKHLAEICDLELEKISRLIVRAGGKVLQDSFIALPEDFQNGKKLLIPPPSFLGGDGKIVFV